MRPLRSSAAVLAPLAGLSALSAGVGVVLADKVLAPPRRHRFRRRILAVAPGEVRLAGDVESRRPGTYGLSWPGGRAVVGEVLDADSRTVTRRLLTIEGPSPVPGPASLGHVHAGDPSALGLDFEEVELSSDVGPVPAWVVPSGGDTWAVVVHGWGGTRASCLDVLPMLRRLGVSAIVPAYRNDPDAPPSPDGRYHLGAAEWQEIDSATAHALSAGARRIVLYGWSMGGAIVLQSLARSRPRSRPAVVAVVLDSPVLDWRSVLLHQGRARRVPLPLIRLAMRVIEARIAVDLDAFDWLRRAGELDVPVLVFHGESDPVVPYAESRALEAARPDLVTLVSIAGAGHIGSWNVDSTRYERELSDFLVGAGDERGRRR